MKRIWLIVLALSLLTLPLGAESVKFGGRYSNYSTDLDIGTMTIDTGREGSIGAFVDYRTGMLVLKGEIDSDFESDARFDFDLDSQYSRNRFEFLAGYAALPFMDIEGGFRYDEISFDGFSFTGSGSSDVDFNHQAVALGLHFHTTQTGKLGWYGLVRGYLGTIDSTDGDDVDAGGYRAETAFVIPFGDSGWEVAPGFETERLDTDDIVDGEGVRFNTDRFFIRFAFNWGR